MNTKQTEKQWVQASLLAAVGSNLAYWAAQPAAALRHETNNLHTAVSYGLRLRPTQTQAARLLSQSFEAARTQPAAWLPVYTQALQLKALPSSLRGGLLYQHAVVLWQHDQATEACQAFERSRRFAQRHGLAALHMRSLIGLCLAHSPQPAKANRAAQALQDLLPRTRSQPTLRAQASAALGTVAYFAKEHAQAAQHFAAALEYTPTSQAQGQLHILAGLCAHALADIDTAIAHYNAAARSLQQRASPAQMARVELLRATAHYDKRTRGQQVRLQPAIAALQRAAELLNQTEQDARSRAQLESLLGRTYTRSGEVARGIRYLSSALELSESSGDRRLAADIFAALHELENKNPA
ncbi:MAG: hypothetical protein KF701_10565 [Anaerolineales bacterium]|nr:MAG: hypothetical protein KF701_10565 [Anaerolineales bacterium]